MNNLIVFDGNSAILDPQVAEAIATFEAEVKEIKAQEEILKQRILEEMERNGLLKIDTPHLLINYIAGTDRETFDSKSFRKEHPDLYDDFVKMTPVKASIRIKVK